MSKVDEWERLAAPDPRGVLVNQRSSALLLPPAARMAELTAELGRVRQALAEAASAVRRLDQDQTRYHTFHGTSFGGITMAQHWCDLVLWEALLNERPGARAIFELGTWQGGFAWWLWAQTQARGMEFYTYDSVVPDAEIPCFEKIDVFAQAEELGAKMAQAEPIILFCDNGNKPREIATFAPYLTHPDTLIVVHDWHSEISESDIPDLVEEVFGDYCDSLGSISRVFKRKETDA